MWMGGTVVGGSLLMGENSSGGFIVDVWEGNAWRVQF